VAAVGAFTIAVASIGLLASFGSTPASASEASPASPGASTVAVYIAQPGDTLWSIASANRGAISHRSYLDALVSLNSSTVVQIGQAVVLP
jgi:Tfp pilus assembly protein FimV